MSQLCSSVRCTCDEYILMFTVILTHSYRAELNTKSHVYSCTVSTIRTSYYAGIMRERLSGLVLLTTSFEFLHLVRERRLFAHLPERRPCLAHQPLYLGRHDAYTLLLPLSPSPSFFTDCKEFSHGSRAVHAEGTCA